jgi:hypothetical protein
LLYPGVLPTRAHDAPREDRYAIPAFLAAPNRMTARLPDCFRGKVGVRCFQFLKADNLGFRFAKPGKQVPQAAFDVVDVETGDFHPRFEQTYQVHD